MLPFMLNQNLNSVNRKILSLLDMKEAGMEEKPILSASCFFCNDCYFFIAYVDTLVEHILLFIESPLLISSCEQ